MTPHTVNTIFTEIQKEGGWISPIYLLPILPVLCSQLKSCNGPAERVCKSNTIRVFFINSLLDDFY